MDLAMMCLIVCLNSCTGQQVINACAYHVFALCYIDIVRHWAVHPTVLPLKELGCSSFPFLLGVLSP